MPRFYILSNGLKIRSHGADDEAMGRVLDDAERAGLDVTEVSRDEWHTYEASETRTYVAPPALGEGAPPHVRIERPGS